MSALFISDLHLSSSRPETTRLFERFLAGPALEAGKLFILGDLFDYWAGDDDLDEPFVAHIVNSIGALSRKGAHVYFMRGNRDFLVNAGFAKAARLDILDDPVRIELQDGPAMLSHGDALCTDDSDYQAFRARVRAPAWIAEFLAKPLTDRKRQIEAMRAQSELVKQVKSTAIMDVAPDAVREFFLAYGGIRLIHGHTHRPARHEHNVSGRICERWVLPDWHTTGGYLESSPQGIGANPFP